MPCECCIKGMLNIYLWDSLIFIMTNDLIASSTESWFQETETLPGETETLPGETETMPGETTINMRENETKEGRFKGENWLKVPFSRDNISSVSGE